MRVNVDLDVLRIVYEASLSVCDNCTSDDCGICDIRKSQDEVSELLKEWRYKT